MKQIQITVTSEDFRLGELKDALLTVIMNKGIDAMVEKAEEFSILVFVEGKIVEVEDEQEQPSTK